MHLFFGHVSGYHMFATNLSQHNMGIDTQTKHIYKLIEVGDNNTETTLTVRSFTPNKDLAASTFVFLEKDYPNYYIDRF